VSGQEAKTEICTEARVLTTTDDMNISLTLREDVSFSKGCSIPMRNIQDYDFSRYGYQTHAMDYVLQKNLGLHKLYIKRFAPQRLKCNYPLCTLLYFPIAAIIWLL
jgi:hypothetical protein